MTDFRDILDELQGDGFPSQVHFGIIAEAAADITTPVPVILPDYDADLQWGPAYWQSRDAVSLPAKGDFCCVLIDNRRNVWVVAWWPFG